ncbi:MAG: TonB-dependent receptor [Gammaproteobacteria bacterium]
MIDRRTPGIARPIALLAVVMAVLPVAAFADELQEITITAQKREQKEQDVGISIAAFSGDELRSLGIKSSTDLVAMAPGVSVAGAYGGQFLTFSIRGVTQNDFLDHTEAPTSVYVDEAYMAMMTTQQFTLFDVEHAEILKGPQGTLFGRNSTGGTVNFASRKPTQDTQGYLDVSYARFDQARVEGAIGGALSDRVSGRVAFLYNHSSPILSNSFPGGGDTWNDESYAGRAHLQFDFSDDSRLLLTGYGGRSESRSSPWQWSGTIAEVNANGQVINAHKVSPTETRECIGPGGANTDCGNDVLGSPDGFTLTRPVPGGDFFGYREAEGTRINQDVPDSNVNTLTLYGGTANFKWGRDALSLVSVTDYKTARKDFQLDGTVSPARGINTIAQAKTRSYSEELRLMGTQERWRWVTGLYYLNIDADVPTTGIWLPVDGDTPTIVVANFQGFQFLDQYELQTKSTSLFGQAEYDLTPTLTAIAGVRATREKKDFDYRSDIYLQTSQVAPRIFNKGMFIAPVRKFNGDSSKSLVTARGALEWKPQKGLLVYGSFNRGVKAGGFNAPFAGGAPITDAQIPYKEETLNAYETGFKSTFMEGSAQLNASVFYYDYRNYQTFQFIGLTSQVTNNDAEYKGADLELTVSPAKGLLLQLAGSYLHTRVLDVVSFGIVADKEASFAPEFQASGLARYEWPAFGGLASVQGSFSSSSSYFNSLTNFDSLESGSHIAFNGRMGFRLPGDHTEISVFVDNIGNKRYDTLRFDLSSSCGCTLATYAKPRVYGLSINYSL